MSVEERALLRSLPSTEQAFLVELYVRFPGINLVSDMTERPVEQAALDL